MARALGVGDHILLGRGEETSGGRDKSSILADAVEALIGAVYVEHGIQVATAFVRRLVDPLLTQSDNLGAGLDWKTSLQERTAQLDLGVPEYVVTEEGPDHAKTFHASVLVQGVVLGKGSGKSKKEAEQGAAVHGLRVPDRDPAERLGAGPAAHRLIGHPAATCPSCPRSRSSGAASPAGCSARGSAASRC